MLAKGAILGIRNLNKITDLSQISGYAVYVAIGMYSRYEMY